MIETITRPLKILDFDTECRPMHYSEWRPESQLTAYAWSWVGQKKVHSRMLKQDLSNEREILADMLAAIAEADMIVGHYIRQHDLPLLNDHAIQFELEPIRRVLVQDTKSDLIRAKGMGLSQENLSLAFGLTHKKHSMSGTLWKLANSLTPAGDKEALIRVESDVQQNKELYEELLRRGMLKPARYWHA
ncbi:hypothetical protein [Sinimarinibacterium flocculans]|uniref:hypothetical protein n=1 Tax=Sinimarinibacterium flocculans TaxID=985250 RepID=UPI0024913B20|nr:hypothetical protein [Sinimarinibacterium flocculans]